MRQSSCALRPCRTRTLASLIRQAQHTPDLCPRSPGGTSSPRVGIDATERANALPVKRRIAQFPEKRRCSGGTRRRRPQGVVRRPGPRHRCEPSGQQPDARLARGKLGRYHESLAEGNPLDGVDLRRYLGELGMDLGAFEGLDDNALAEVCRAIENWRGENLDDSDEDVSAEEDGPRGGGNRAVTFSVNVTQGKRAGATPPGTEEAR